MILVMMLRRVIYHDDRHYRDHGGGYDDGKKQGSMSIELFIVWSDDI